MSKTVNKKFHGRVISVHILLERLAVLFDASSDSELCEKSGIGRSTLGNWRQRGSLPKLEVLIDVAKKTGASLDYLLLGNTSDSSAILDVPHYGEIGAGGGDMVSDGRIYEATRETPGATSAPVDAPLQHLTRWGGLVALTVRGRSMEPLFRHGDTLYIYGDDPVASDPERLIGKDCAVVLAGSREGEAYIKRIRRADSGEPGYFNLESLNPMWPVMVDMQLYQARPVRYIRRAI